MILCNEELAVVNNRIPERHEIMKKLARHNGFENIIKSITKHYQLYIFLLPAVIWYVTFAYAPIYGLQIAFKNYNPALGFTRSSWIGFKYFRSFFRSYYFWPVIRNTLALSFYSLLAGFPFPIILALMLNEVQQLRYKKFVQTVTYAPHFISTVVLVGMIYIFLTPRTGLIPIFLRALGFDASKNMLSDPSSFRHVYVWSGIWKSTGWSSIIYLAALSSVDPSIYEAAIIDGASRIQRIRHVNIPAIIPTITILLILNAGSIMSVGFEKVFLLQNELNNETSEVISTYIYKRGLIKADFSFSSAVGLFNNVINFIVLVSVNAATRRLSETSLF